MAILSKLEINKINAEVDRDGLTELKNNLHDSIPMEIDGALYMIVRFEISREKETSIDWLDGDLMVQKSKPVMYPVSIEVRKAEFKC